MQRFKMHVTHRGTVYKEDHPYGEWVHFEDVRRALRALFKAKNLFEWIAALEVLHGFRKE